MGKKEDREQWLAAEQRKCRLQKERDKESASAKRMEEYFLNKEQKLIEMVKKSIKAWIPFEYLLVDSWFTCTELVELVCKCHK